MEKRELVKLFIETMRSLRSLSIHRHDIQAVKKGMYFWKQQVRDVNFISRYIAGVQIDI